MHKYKILIKKGSYTVELSLLTPVIIANFLFVLFSAYYMHDRVIIEKNCYISALRASLCIESNEREEIAYSTFEKETEEKLLGRWEIEKLYSEDGKTVSMRVNGNMIMNEGLLRQVLGQKMFEYKTECVANVVDETKYLRNSRRAK